MKASFEALKAAGALPKWGGGADALPARRNVMPGELRQARARARARVRVRVRRRRRRRRRGPLAGARARMTTGGRRGGGGRARRRSRPPPPPRPPPPAPQMGIKNPEQLAVGSSRNDLAFLVTVTGVFSVLAVLLGQLPGDWVRRALVPAAAAAAAAGG